MRGYPLFLFLLHCLVISAAAAGKSLKPLTADHYCFFSNYLPLSTLKWIGPNASGTTCNGSAEVASIYLSSKLYCTDKELSAGLKLWKNYCQGISTPLLDLSSISVNATPAYLSSLSTVDPYRNKSISLTSPVLLTRSYYDISIRSNVSLPAIPEILKSVSYLYLNYSSRFIRRCPDLSASVGV